MKGWHFIKEDKRLGYRDNRIVRVGRTYKVDCEPVLCVSGLHASKRLIDALRYAPGPILCKVEIGGRIIVGDDKIVGTERTVLAMADVSDILRAFARKCALDVIHLWSAPEVVVRYLKTGDESLMDAAMDAAMAAARRGAEWDAAWAAAWDAARAAAEWDAAMDAAMDAAWAAAEWDAAREKQNRRLVSMVRKADWRTA